MSIDLTIDMHCDTVQRMVDEGLDPSEALADGHLDAARMRAGGLDAQFFAIWVEPEFYGTGGEAAIRRADLQIDALHQLAATRPDVWRISTSVSDLRASKAAGQQSILLALEGGYALDERPERVAHYFERGVRYLSPTWSVSLSWAGSSNDAVGQTRGLNDLGREIIGEMNHLGMMADVSHVSDKTLEDMVEVTKKPLLATHSNCRSLCDVPRNLTDEQIKAIAATGGVVCAVFYPGFVDAEWLGNKDEFYQSLVPHLDTVEAQTTGSPEYKRAARYNACMTEYAKQLARVPMSLIADHIEHMVSLVGIEHVGLGSDFDGIPATLEGLDDVRDIPNLLAELTRRGFSESDLAKIRGGNIVRVMEAHGLS